MDERTELTLDFVIEQMKKDLKRLFLGLLGPYLAICILGLIPSVLSALISGDVLFSFLGNPIYLSMLPFAIVHACQLVSKLIMIKKADFSISTQELSRIEEKFSLWYYLFSVERFVYPAFLFFLTLMQPRMDFERHDHVFVDKKLAAYSKVGDKMHLILYKGKVVAVYNAHLYRRMDEAQSQASASDHRE